MLPEREPDSQQEGARRRRPRRVPRARAVRLVRCEEVGAERRVRMSPLQSLRHLGPGLIAGASALDPTSVATLAIIGSTVGYRLLWLILLLLPMLVTVQVISARVGMVSRRTLEGAIRQRFGRRWALAAMGLVVSVNLLTIAADLEGGAAALQLLVGPDWRWFVLPLALFVGGLLLLGGYYGVQRALRYVLVVFGGYVVAALLARPDWGMVLFHSFVPSVSWEPGYLAGALALMGSSLSSYVYFWETIEVQEERRPLSYLWLVELDAAIGMVAATFLSAFVVITTAATLGVRGETVQTAQDAARALVPLAGPFAEILFAGGLLASALLAIPVLAGTTAYVLADALGWRGNLGTPGPESRPFYAVLLGSLALGAAIAFTGVEPFRFLFLASILGGLGTPVLLLLLIQIARDPGIMCDQQIGGRLAALGWATAGISGAASVAYVIQRFL